MIDELHLDELLNDEHLGAGNFIHKIHEKFYQGSDKKILSLIDNEACRKQDFSIQEIIETARRIASSYEQTGVKPKEVVSLYFQDSIDYFLHFLALNSIGAIPALINGELNTDILLKFLHSVRPNHLVITPEKEAEITKVFAQANYSLPVHTIDALKTRQQAPSRPFYSHEPQDVIMIGHTSGTTGIPKAVIFTHESMFHGVRSQVKKQKGDHILSILPHSHGASISLLMLSFTRGAHVTILSKKDPATIIRAVRETRPNVVIAFPKVYVDLCRHTLDKSDFQSVSYWIATGDASHEKHIRKLISLGHHERDGQTVPGSFFVDNLGSSEFAFAIFRNVHSPQSDNYKRCIGKPFPWVDVAVFNEQGQYLQENSVGRLAVKSKSVTQGYWNNHSLTEMNKIDGYWLTGDLVYFDEKRNFYHVDRTNDSLSFNNVEIYSCQIEEAIMAEINEVFEATVIMTDNNELVAYIELLDSCAASKDEITERVNQLMRQKNWPALSTIELQSANEFIGVTGKKLKRQLRELAH
ncbi:MULTISPECIES: class I adenylate-forming enzyme family protein [Alcaligenes]|jgi:acyl-CoA synthetase (AMP-forming)/AMP-acid ligase II|uniref:class I adenylate-forming enzyme family protein n=1 Tax=Alcaligenes TaxID=507 RepID=UPI0037526326